MGADRLRRARRDDGLPVQGSHLEHVGTGRLAGTFSRLPTAPGPSWACCLPAPPRRSRTEFTSISAWTIKTPRGYRTALLWHTRKDRTRAAALDDVQREVRITWYSASFGLRPVHLSAG